MNQTVYEQLEKKLVYGHLFSKQVKLKFKLDY